MRSLAPLPHVREGRTFVPRIEASVSRSRRLVLVCLGVMMAFLVLLGLEGGLRLVGFGKSYPLFIPVEDAPGYLRANPDVVRRFMTDEAKTPNLCIRPVYFESEKRPSTLRIFVQGSSTAEGYPYGYGASPAGMLQQRLQRTFPERRVEVITTAMCAVNTYTLLDFVDEIIDQHPDAVLIYAGHNEYLGLLGVGSGFSAGRRRAAVRAFLMMRDLRIFQLLRNVVSGRPQETKEQSNRTLMATIAREKRIPYGSALFERGLDQYRANLDAILARYQKAKIPVFIGTVVSNERDQPPFISGHREGTDASAWRRHFESGVRALEAGDAAATLEAVDRAIEMDDAPAQGHFLRARALDRMGRYREARQAYLAAKDRDELRFRAPEAINDIIRKILSLVEHDFDMKGVRVHIDLDSGVPDTQVNENEIAQVILNLANNAIDSMPAGGDLRVSTKFDESSERICIEVHDTGCGIKETDRTRVFEPFFTTKEVGKGTGLGLSICYKIVENHLGSIEFDSVIAKGTTFRVYLPAKVHTEVGVG